MYIFFFFLWVYFCISCQCRNFEIELCIWRREKTYNFKPYYLLHILTQGERHVFLQLHIIVTISIDCCAILQGLLFVLNCVKKDNKENNTLSKKAKAVVGAIFIRARALHKAFKIAYVLKILLLQAGKMSQSFPWVFVEESIS